MLRQILHRLAATAWIYDLIQKLAGGDVSWARLKSQIEPLSQVSIVLDVGGGTGRLRSLWPTTCIYICLDVEWPKLQGFLSKYRKGAALLSDAIRNPLNSRSVDVVICVDVTHHIPDELLPLLFSESARVLKDSGKLILLDAIWAPARWLARLLWKYDRGSYPRAAATLHALVSKHFTIDYWEHYSVYHEYILCVATKRNED